jgi:hypothetical protein
MAQNYLPKKLNLVSQLQDIANQQIVLLARARDLATAYTDLGFNPAGANPIVDADLQGGNAPFPAVSATDVANAFLALQDIDQTLAATSRQDYKRLRALQA